MLVKDLVSITKGQTSVRRLPPDLAKTGQDSWIHTLNRYKEAVTIDFVTNFKHGIVTS
jgi:hypothetical protein